MSEHCGRTFDEALLSGYVDGALTQGGEQRVRLHLEDCGICRGLVDQMRELKDVTRTSRFDVPSDDQWSETPRTTGSRLTLGLGWILVIAWGTGVLGTLLWKLATETENLWQALIAFGGIFGFGLLLIGALLDRFASYKTDRYREVRK